MLRDAGLNAGPNAKFDWIHDTFLILIRMFPNGCPPTVLVSMNQSFDPHLHSTYTFQPAIRELHRLWLWLFFAAKMTTY